MSTASPWRTPPSEAARIELSHDGRNLLCASVDWRRGEAVLGSADHAVYAIDLARRSNARTLHTKTGHREWVTAVCHLADGRVASGGMDARICLWSTAGLACSTLEGHAGSVAALAPVPAAPAALLSAGYDKRLIAWDCGSGRHARPCQQHVMAGHAAPVLQLAVGRDGAAASADRDGCLLRWDLQAGAPLGRPVQAHAGHCTALAWWAHGGNSGSSSAGAGPAPLLLSGGQDGAVCLWDGRTAARQAAVAAHADGVGRGAVGSLHAGLAAAPHIVVSTGADGAVRGLDARRALQPAWAIALPDFPYCAAAAPDGGLLFVGCGNGSVLAVDTAAGAAAYSLPTVGRGAAVRSLDVGADLLVAGCDDGSVALYAV